MQRLRLVVPLSFQLPILNLNLFVHEQSWFCFVSVSRLPQTLICSFVHVVCYSNTGDFICFNQPLVDYCIRKLSYRSTLVVSTTIKVVWNQPTVPLLLHHQLAVCTPISIPISLLKFAISILILPAYIYQQHTYTTSIHILMFRLIVYSIHIFSSTTSTNTSTCAIHLLLRYQWPFSSGRCKTSSRSIRRCSRATIS